MEGGWDPEAYIDAYRHAQARTAAIDAPFMHAEPEEFSSAAPVGGVQFAEPLAPIEATDPSAHREELAPMPTNEPADPMPADDVFDPLSPGDGVNRSTPDGSASLDSIPTPAETTSDALLRQPFDAAVPHDGQTPLNSTRPPTADANVTPHSQSPARPQASLPDSGAAAEADAFWNLDPLHSNPPPSEPSIQPVPPAKPSAVPQAASDAVTPIGYWHAVE